MNKPRPVRKPKKAPPREQLFRENLEEGNIKQATFNEYIKYMSEICTEIYEGIEKDKQ